MAMINMTMAEKTTLHHDVTQPSRNSSIEDTWSSNNWYTIAVVGTGLLIFVALTIVRRHQKNIMLKKKEEDYLHYFHTILPHSTIYGKIEHKPSLMEMMQKGLNGLTSIYTDLYMLQQLHHRQSSVDVTEHRQADGTSSMQMNSTSSFSDLVSAVKQKTGNVHKSDVTIEMNTTSAQVNCSIPRTKFYLGHEADHQDDGDSEEDAGKMDEQSTFLKTTCKMNQKRYDQLFASTKYADPDTEEGRKTIRNNARQFLKLNLAKISESEANDSDEPDNKMTKQLLKRSSMPILNGASGNVMVTEL